MNKRGVGAIFCLISSILYSVGYLSATLIFISGISSLEYAIENIAFTTPSIMALLIGIAFIIWGWKE